MSEQTYHPSQTDSTPESENIPGQEIISGFQRQNSSLPTTPQQSIFPGAQPSFREAYTENMQEYIHRRGMPLIRAGAVVWRQDHGELEFLLVHETRIRKGLKWEDGDTWNIPGGCIDIDTAETRTDTLENTAIREVLEETGQTVRLGPICHVGQRTDLENPYIMIIFGATIIQSAPFTSTREIKETAWFTRDFIRKMQEDRLLRNPELIINSIDALIGGNFRKGIRPVVYTPKI